MRHGCCAEINISALRHNVALIRQKVPYAIVAVVKADAYGHGLKTVVETLETLVDMFAVAYIEEATALRKLTAKPILALEGFFDQDELQTAATLQIACVVHSDYQLRHLESFQISANLDLWIKVDSGMNRLGFPPTQFRQAYQRIRQHSSCASLTVMSHLSCADERDRAITSEQISRFYALINDLSTPASLANSAGILAWPQAMSNAHVQWIRPGIMLYGASPFENESAEHVGLRPVMTLRSMLITIRELKVGDCVGYGARWCAQRPSRIGVVAIGYGDGYPRHAPTGTPVLVNEQRVPLVGRVSMDMITVDLTDLPTAAIGDPVVLWGQGLPVEEVARFAGTISYDLLTGVTARVARRVIDRP